MCARLQHCCVRAHVRLSLGSRVVSLLATRAPSSPTPPHPMGRGMAPPRVWRRLRVCCCCGVCAAQAVARRVAYQTFSHVLELDITFHMNRRTGRLSRILERGVRPCRGRGRAAPRVAAQLRRACVAAGVWLGEARWLRPAAVCWRRRPAASGRHGCWTLLPRPHTHLLRTRMPARTTRGRRHAQHPDAVPSAAVYAGAHHD
jgi:hypothetical protein